MLKGKKIVVGVSGGIAAYKACEIVSRLKKMQADVHVVMTKNATEFVMPLTFETLSNNRVITDMFARDFSWEVEHVSLAKAADLFIVAPATANVLGKAAAGIADDFLSTTLMGARAPVLFAPAMNTGMLNSAAVKANLSLLASRGYHFIYGGAGRLACGDIGEGRMAEPVEITEAALKILFPVQDYCGKKIVVTAGGTSEDIDGVRCLTNYSSGKMGAAIAQAAKTRGAAVVLIAGNTSCEFPDVPTVRVGTTEEMYKAVTDAVGDADMLIMAAAPCDYVPAERVKNKIKDSAPVLRLKKTVDIAKSVGREKGTLKLVIFCAETENLIDNARKKLAEKNADMVCANDLLQTGAGFSGDTNDVTIITSGGDEYRTGVLTKTEIAEIILDKAATLFNS